MTVDLRTQYLGLELRSPIVASASPLTGGVETARMLEAAGAAALVLPSLFEEEILHEEIEMSRSLEAGADSFAESLDYFPNIESWSGAGDRYITRLEQIKAQAGIPVIASLNATTPGGWVTYAKRLQDAGADALELNIYHVAADPSVTAAHQETNDLALIEAVRAAVTIPVAIKLSPYYSAMANFTDKVAATGVNALVLFNRFYQPDLDLETLDVVNRLELSAAWELRLPLRWIAILRPRLGDGISLAATSGVHTGRDVVKALLVGADVAMVTSILLRHGPDQLRVIESEMVAWLAEHEYESVAQIRGSASASSVEDPSTFERANYMQTLRSWSVGQRPVVRT